MTSNAEEQANPPAAAHGAAAESHQTCPCHATGAPCCARQAKVGEKSQLGRTTAKKPKGRQTGQTRHRCPRGQQGSQSPKPAEAAGRRFVERSKESYRVVGAFCPWVPQRHGEQADGAQARLSQGRRREPPLHRPKLDSHNPSKQRAAGPSSAAFLCPISSRTNTPLNAGVLRGCDPQGTFLPDRRGLYASNHLLS